jgi:hypothetical protein
MESMIHRTPQLRSATSPETVPPNPVTPEAGPNPVTPEAAPNPVTPEAAPNPVTPEAAQRLSGVHPEPARTPDLMPYPAPMDPGSPLRSGRDDGNGRTAARGTGWTYGGRGDGAGLQPGRHALGFGLSPGRTRDPLPASG